jgi:hypothetical protein
MEWTTMGKIKAFNLEKNKTTKQHTKNVSSYFNMSISKTMSKAPQSINADLMTEDEIHAKLQEGYEDVKSGRVLDANTAFLKFIEKHKSEAI